MHSFYNIQRFTRQCHAAEGAAQIKGVFWFYQRRRVLFHTTQRHRRCSSQYSMPRPTLDGRLLVMFLFFFSFFFLIVTKDERSTHAWKHVLCLTVASWLNLSLISEKIAMDTRSIFLTISKQFCTYLKVQGKNRDLKLIRKSYIVKKNNEIIRVFDYLVDADTFFFYYSDIVNIVVSSIFSIISSNFNII